MKKFTLTMIFLLIFLPSAIFAQSARKAYESLKKIEAQADVGISLNDFLKMVGNAKYEVDSYAEDKNTKLAGYLQLALLHYEMAAQVWDVSKSLVNQNFEQASKALKEAKKLMK